MKDALANLLNRVEALCRMEHGGFKALAQAIGERQERVCEWVTNRKYQPSGVAAMKLHTWAEQNTIRIGTSGDKKLQARYRREYRAVLSKRRVPGAGRKSK